MVARGIDVGRVALAVLTTSALVVTLLLVLGGPPAFANHVTPELIPGASNSDKTCAANEGQGQSWTEFKLEGSALVNGAHTDGSLTVTISNLTANGFDWSSNIGVDSVIVKSGQAGTNLYRYDPPAESTGDAELVTPGGSGISHITFCYDLPDATTTTTEQTTTTTAPTTSTAAVTATTSTVAATTTTILDEVLATVITATTAPVEISATGELPFTGAESGTPALVAVALLSAGLLALVFSRRVED